MFIILPAKNVYILIFIPMKDKGLPWLLSCKSFSDVDYLRIMESLRVDTFFFQLLSKCEAYIPLLLSKSILNECVYLP